VNFKTANETLVFLEYLKHSLIPVDNFTGDGIADFEKKLISLSYEERRKVNRKFRKIFKKIAKKKNFYDYPHFVSLYGLASYNPSKEQIRARRRLVHHEFKTLVNK